MVWCATVHASAHASECVCVSVCAYVHVCVGLCVPVLMLVSVCMSVLPMCMHVLVYACGPWSLLAPQPVFTAVAAAALAMERLYPRRARLPTRDTEGCSPE